MGKFAVIFSVAGLMLAASSVPAANGHADQVTSPVSGAMAPVTNTCFAVIDGFNLGDCSYAGTRYPGKTSGGTGNGAATVAGSWIGPTYAAGFYAAGSAADPFAPAGANAALAYRPSVGDNKYPIPLLGSVTIDDQGTASPADDTIAATWTFGQAVHHTQVQQNDYAIETWDSFTHVMAATAVNPTATVANANGGFDYVIGSRGKPTPVVGGFPHGPLPGDGTLNPDPFPSESAEADIANPTGPRWVTTGSTDIASVSQRVGIERSAGFGNISGNPYPGTATLQPNVGGQTTGSFTNYHCTDDTGDNDCSTSEYIFGSQSEGGGSTSPPGFENLILLLATDAAGKVTEARAYWTREYMIRGFGSRIGNDPANPNQWVTNNSWNGGRFDFRGCSLPATVADTATVVEGTANAVIQVLGNDTLGCAEPNVVQLVSGPAHGSATVSADGRSILYSPSTSEPAPNVYYDGPDSLTYKLVDGLGNESSPATVSITVTRKLPVAGTLNGSSSGGSPAIVTALTAGSLGSGSLAQHDLDAGAGTLGSCTVSGSGGVDGDQLTFTPTPGAGNGTGGCSYTITDLDGDTATAQFIVDVRGNAGSAGGSKGPQLPSGGSSLDWLVLGALLAGTPLLARRRHRA
ncbi:MAG: Ig-like domain-containing protein [Gammaproteobacteria bacterium]|nr:MAG: Ig-like domain-containing protein [Gammaproteobacteria bacterium]